ncbi:TetR family transcriptional regulator C-terminal domain-containing protein [Paenibacillus sp. UMB4589-SE434]|uniref:TetR/AcrR family transcriptional regulator n=1 Tax=Paenibacillus sp. UMB4589-SE434 TaxID=3046314 RepID=UPI0025516D91|nr:TetR family transcriptional regulator C-terminal domain-containing protein [Paenibacillus sp. UMB4589-SE434]MDK8181812.1 TetR family transcriptional regulator C-terminal domain-containing protein [Paenibacillus sp. UMB4589-SE434]
MPKIVDHNKQKEKLAEATWRVILRDGLERASVRNIALEAGISAGSMRHYFSTQSELLAFSMRLVSQRVKTRISSIQYTGELMEDIQQLLCEILPMDEERSAEMEVWFGFTAKALVDPTLHGLCSEVYDELRRVISSVMEALGKSDLLREGLDFEIETERLYAVIDGLAVHAVVMPSRLNPEMIRSVIAAHLRSLCK